MKSIKFKIHTIVGRNSTIPLTLMYMYQSSVDLGSGKVETKAYTYIVGYTKIF